MVSWIEVGEDGAAFLDFFFGDGIAGSGDGFAEVDEVLTLAASGKSDDFAMSSWMPLPKQSLTSSLVK